MAVIDIKQCTIKVKDGTTPKHNELRVKVGTGNLQYTETLNREYILDRGIIDSVRNGDQQPMDVSFEMMWEEIAASIGAGVAAVAGVPSMEEAIKQFGAAEAWASSDTDQCQPYAVDIEVINDADCVQKDREHILLPDFRWESLQHDIRAGSISASGKCNSLYAIILHSHVDLLAALFQSANSEFLSRADGAPISVTTALTWSGWVWFDAVPAGTVGIAGKFEAGAQAEWLLYMVAGKLRVQIATAAGEALNANFGESTQTMVAGRWYNVTIQYDGAGAANADRVKMWVNGVAETLVFTGTVPATAPAATSPYREGAMNTPEANFLDGRIGPVGYWLSATIGAAHFTALYNAGLGLNYADLTAAQKTNLAAWWAHGEESGSRADSHTGGLTLTDNATVLSEDGVRKQVAPAA